ncbi:hypothetical protein BGZ80_007558 [Entomortierella chlamydospora]|uniref:Uncharacterized protein n=1 Tax=Entomortierella chlamydospora TaxID=101097 RepID=A0A9P6N4P5_9FUNG|nr:hypothetical protein BGZ79_007062 [Entomortierella chlamydospora]KAG0023866.1 hypothetical protein BGZ80_007558 [Entomortierella chlamydospora]
MSTEPGTSWIQSTCGGSPRAFFEAFDIYVKQYGYQKYTQTIQESNLDMDTKLDLWQKFKYWKANDGVQFWLDRQSQSSQIITASTLVKGSESYAKESIHRTGKENTGDKDIESSMSSIVSQAENGKKWSLGTAFIENLQKTPRRRALSPTPQIPTISADSPNFIPVIRNEPNPLDDVDEDDFIIPDNTDNTYRISAILDGRDIGIGFRHLFQDYSIRCYPDFEGSDSPPAGLFRRIVGSFPTIREKAYKIGSVDATAVRNEVRSSAGRLDTFETTLLAFGETASQAVAKHSKDSLEVLKLTAKEI